MTLLELKPRWVHPDVFVVPMKESVIWQMKGAFKKGNFTVSPSIHAGASGHWHGHIQNGHCTGA